MRRMYRQYLLLSCYFFAEKYTYVICSNYSNPCKDSCDIKKICMCGYATKILDIFAVTSYILLYLLLTDKQIANITLLQALQYFKL